MSKRIVSLIMAIILVLGMTGCDWFIKTNDGKVDILWYMNLSDDDSNGDKNLPKPKNGEVAAVALEDKYSEEFGIVKDGDCFININTVKSEIDDRFYYDKNEQLVMFTNATDIYYSSVNTSQVNGKQTEKKDYLISFVENKICYINAKFVKDYIDMDYKLIKKKGKKPNIINLSYKVGKIKEAVLDDDIEMRTNGNYQNLIVEEIEEDTKVSVIEENKNWDKVKTSEGLIGYVPSKYVDDIETKDSKYKSDDDTYTHKLLDEDVNLVWQIISTEAANDNFASAIRKVEGVNVVSPTWLEIENTDGNISSKVSREYVDKAHDNGMQVWALLDDFKNKKIDKTVLTNTSARQSLVMNAASEVESNNIDGINIDFEYVTGELADDYLQFLRELSIQCRKKEIVFSIDNYSPTNSTSYYDWKQQYKIADYVIFMNYDEHNSGSKVPGSVASLEYMENGIKNGIEKIGDSKRIVNAMPFYTRLWEMTPEGKGSSDGVFVEDAANGNYYLNSQALGMTLAEKTYKKAKVKPTFNKATGQNYVMYEDGATTCEMWLEDETSIKSRLKLKKKYKLGGNAYWALGLEKDSIWKVIKDNQ